MSALNISIRARHSIQHGDDMGRQSTERMILLVQQSPINMEEETPNGARYNLQHGWRR